MNGFQALEEIRRTDRAVGILIMSQIASKESINNAFKLGANGYISKNIEAEFIGEAVRQIADEGFYIGKEINEMIRSEIAIRLEYPKKHRFVSVGFTATELIVLEKAAKELSSAEIAEAMHINLRTVESHRNNIMKKTGAKNFVGAILFAVSNNYISLQI